ncbi:MAG: SRPBCC family protein [Deltaproteobacteria bacterium]|nr:SRPBCC family protein [Deltaproteobacteria bacterium]
MLTLSEWLLFAATGFAAEVEVEVAAEIEVAAEPEIEVLEEADGTVRVEVVVAHSVAEVRTLVDLVDDPVTSAALTPEILSVEVAPGEPCQEITTRSRGLFRPLTYTVQRCPAADGWTEVLLRSDDFDDYWSEWVVRPSEEGTRVTFRIRSDPNLPVPRSLVRKGIRRSATRTVENLLESLHEKK